MTAPTRRFHREIMPRAEQKAVPDDDRQRLRALEVPELRPFETYRLVSDGDDEAVILADPATYRGHVVGNSSFTYAWVHLFNKASAPAGGDVPEITIPMPNESGANQFYDDGTDDEIFDVGLAIAVSTLATGVGTTSIGSSLIVVTIFYNPQ